MRLVSKVALVLAAVITLSVVLNYAVLRTTVMPAFAQLERDTADQNARRVLDAIDSSLDHMRLSLQDWAWWDDTYEFALDDPAGARDAYIEDNLYLESLTALDLDFMYFLDASGTVIWGMAADPEEGEEIPAEQILSDEVFAAGSPALLHAEWASITSGVLSSVDAPLLVASARILPTDESDGGHVGTMVIGRVLDAAMIEALQEQTHVAFHLHDAGGHDLPAAAIDDLGGFAAEGSFHTVEDGDNTITYAAIRDLAGQVVGVMHVVTPRDISAVGVRTMRYAMLSLLVVGIVVMLVIGALLQRVVLKPIGALTDHVLEIKRTGILSRREPMRRDDEVGFLYAEFDRMLGQLESARQELVDQSYKAGIAEMAAGILHNIRNQLSPLTMRIGRLRKILTAPTDGKVARAFEELAADEALSERSAKLVQYLQLSLGEGARGGETALADIDAMARQLARVEDVLGEQDRFSRAKRVIEQVSLSDIVTRAISLLPDAENSGIEITVDSGVGTLGAFQGDRFILTQIVNNLLINSTEAIKASGVDDGRIEIVASTRRSSDGGEEVAVKIRDDGVGIAADVMPRIFERGYTTKGGGKGGFGLHWCANTVATFNGRIHAESQGDGKGTTMHIVLPTKSALESAA